MSIYDPRIADHNARVESRWVLIALTLGAVAVCALVVIAWKL